MKSVIILRGCPGCGKSALATMIRTISCSVVVSADDYFTNQDGSYVFDKSKLNEAHYFCYRQFKRYVSMGVETIIVDNTNTRSWEFAKYEEEAKQNGYTVFSLIVENRHNGQNSHGVPREVVQSMRDRFEISL